MLIEILKALVVGLVEGITAHRRPSRKGPPAFMNMRWAVPPLNSTFRMPGHSRNSPPKSLSSG